MTDPGVVAPAPAQLRLVDLWRRIGLRSQSPEWERAFSAAFLAQNFRQMQFSVGLAALLIFADYVFDAVMHGERLLLGNQLRLYLVMPVIVGLFALTFLRIAQTIYPAMVIAFFGLLAPALTCALLLIDREGWLGLTTYVGALNLMFVIVYVFWFMGLRITHSILTGTYVFVVFIVGIVFDEVRNAPMQVYLFHGGTVLMLGVFVGYVREAYSRQSFSLRTNLEAQRAVNTELSNSNVASRDVFICHSTKDFGVVTEVAAYLEGKGVSCWHSERDVFAGYSWRQLVLYAIVNCQVVLLVISDSAAASPEVAKEVSLAKKYLKPILPIRIDEVSTLGEIEYEIANLQYVDPRTDQGLVDPAVVHAALAPMVKGVADSKRRMPN